MATAADRRRFNGPEGSAPIKFIKSDTPKEPLPLLDPKTRVRHDGRRPDEVRPNYLKTGLVSQANGSAYIETGKTKIVCAVYGPHPARRDAPYSAKAKLNVEVKFAPFACPGRRKAPGKDTESATLSSQLAQALLPSLRLDLFPKSAIDLFLTILECDGPINDISAGVTAASVALAEAGVQMYGLTVGCCASLASVDGKLVTLLDPTNAESRQSQGLITLSCMPALESSTHLAFEGVASRHLIMETLKTLQDSCAQIHVVASTAILDARTTEEKPAAAA